MAGVCGQIGLVRGTALADAGAVLNRSGGPKPTAQTGAAPQGERTMNKRLPADPEGMNDDRTDWAYLQELVGAARSVWAESDDPQGEQLLPPDMRQALTRLRDALKPFDAVMV